MHRIRSTAILLLVILPFGCQSPPSRDKPLQNGFAVLPLTAPIRTRDLAAFETVEGLARYIATRFGYILVLDPPAPAEASWIVRWPPNPAILRPETLSAQNALNGAVYPRGQLVIDSVHRSISFRMAPADAHSPANPFYYPATGTDPGLEIQQ